MAIEDIIYGKKRHIFGGIQPGDIPMASFVNNMDGTVTITVTLPDATVIDGQKICDVGGAVIRRKYTYSDIPKNEFDGEHVYTFCEESNGVYSNVSGRVFSFTDTVDGDKINSEFGLVYKIFPFSTQGVYNRSAGSHSIGYITDALGEFGEGGVIYGYDITMSSSTPAVTYPSDVDNYGYTPAGMNFSTGSFDYGSWSIDNFFMPRPVLLSNTGTVYKYLNPDNYEEDTSRNDVSTYLTGSSGSYNAMMRWPKIYVKREIVNGTYKFRCSNQKWDDSWDCLSNYNLNDEIVDYFYTPIYNGYVTSSKLRSLSGKTPKVSYGFTDFLTDAEYNGEGWSLETITDRMLIQDLLVMMAKTRNLQSAFGNGCNGAKVTTTGNLNYDGLFWGDDADYTRGVKVFGMENWWGNYGRFTAGCFMYNKQYHIKLTPGYHDGSSVLGYQSSYSGSVVTGSPFDATGENYIKNMILTPGGLMPSRGSGSTSQYWCDLFYSTITTGTSYPAICGFVPTYTSDAEMGPFTVGFNVGPSSNTFSTANASLSYR